MKKFFLKWLYLVIVGVLTVLSVNAAKFKVEIRPGIFDKQFLVLKEKVLKHGKPAARTVWYMLLRNSKINIERKGYVSSLTTQKLLRELEIASRDCDDLDKFEMSAKKIDLDERLYSHLLKIFRIRVNEI